MEEKKKSNANTTALIGAAFLMATSAIGPGFLTQTATFTGQYDTFDCQVFILDDCSRKFSGNQGSVIVICTVCEHLARCL